MKTYVSITAEHKKDGTLIPITLHWPDGRSWPIDKILDTKKSVPAMIAGGHGDFYLCRIVGREVRLFHEGTDNRWFVEH